MNMSILNQINSGQTPQQQISSAKKQNKGIIQKLPPQIPVSQVQSASLVQSKMFSSQTQASIDINSPKNKLKALLLGSQSACSSTNLQKLLAMSQQYPSIQALNFNQTQRSNIINMSQDSYQEIKSLTQLQNYASNTSGQGENVYKNSLLGDTSKSVQSLKLKLKAKEPLKGSFQEHIIDKQHSQNFMVQNKVDNATVVSLKQKQTASKLKLPLQSLQNKFSLSQRLQNLAAFTNQSQKTNPSQSSNKASQIHHKNTSVSKTAKNSRMLMSQASADKGNLYDGLKSNQALLEEQLKTSAKKRNSHLNGISHHHLVETMDRQPRYSHANINEDQIVLTSLKKKATVKKYSSHSPSSLEKIQLKKFLVTQGLNPSTQLLKKYTSESPNQGSIGCGSQSKVIKQSLQKSGVKKKDLTILSSLFQIKQQLNFQNERDKFIKTAFSASGFQNIESGREFITNLNFPTSQNSKVRSQKKKHSQDSIKEDILSGKSQHLVNDRTIQQEEGQGFDILSDSTNGHHPQNRSLENFHQTMHHQSKPIGHQHHMSLAFHHKSPPEQKYQEQLLKIPKIQSKTIKAGSHIEKKKLKSMNSIDLEQKQIDASNHKQKAQMRIAINQSKQEQVLEQVVYENSELRSRLEKLESQVSEVNDLRRKLDEKDKLILQLQQSIVHMTTSQSAHMQQSHQQNFNMSLNLSSLQQSKASPSANFQLQTDNSMMTKQQKLTTDQEERRFNQLRQHQNRKYEKDLDDSAKGINSFKSQDPNSYSKLIDSKADDYQGAHAFSQVTIAKKLYSQMSGDENRSSQKHGKQFSQSKGKCSINVPQNVKQNQVQGSQDISNQFTFNYEHQRRQVTENPQQMKSQKFQQESSVSESDKFGFSYHEQSRADSQKFEQLSDSEDEVTENSPGKIRSDDQIDFENLFSNIQLSAGKQRPSRGTGAVTNGHVQRITNLQDYVDFGAGGGSTDNFITTQGNRYDQNGRCQNITEQKTQVQVKPSAGSSKKGSIDESKAQKQFEFLRSLSMISSEKKSELARTQKEKGDNIQPSCVITIENSRQFLSQAQATKDFEISQQSQQKEANNQVQTTQVQNFFNSPKLMFKNPLQSLKCQISDQAASKMQGNGNNHFHNQNWNNKRQQNEQLKNFSLDSSHNHIDLIQQERDQEIRDALMKNNSRGCENISENEMLTLGMKNSMLIKQDLFGNPHNDLINYNNLRRRQEPFSMPIDSKSSSFICPNPATSQQQNSGNSTSYLQTKELPIRQNQREVEVVADEEGSGSGERSEIINQQLSDPPQKTKFKLFNLNNQAEISQKNLHHSGFEKQLKFQNAKIRAYRSQEASRDEFESKFAISKEAREEGGTQQIILEDLNSSTNQNNSQLQYFSPGKIFNKNQREETELQLSGQQQLYSSSHQYSVQQQELSGVSPKLLEEMRRFKNKLCNFIGSHQLKIQQQASHSIYPTLLHQLPLRIPPTHQDQLPSALIMQSSNTQLQERDCRFQRSIEVGEESIGGHTGYESNNNIDKNNANNFTKQEGNEFQSERRLVSSQESEDLQDKKERIKQQMQEIFEQTRNSSLRNILSPQIPVVYRSSQDFQRPQELSERELGTVGSSVGGISSHPLTQKHALQKQELHFTAKKESSLVFQEEGQQKRDSLFQKQIFTKATAQTIQQQTLMTQSESGKKSTPQTLINLKLLRKQSQLDDGEAPLELIQTLMGRGREEGRQIVRNEESLQSDLQGKVALTRPQKFQNNNIIKEQRIKQTHSLEGQKNSSADSLAQKQLIEEDISADFSSNKSNYIFIENQLNRQGQW